MKGIDFLIEKVEKILSFVTIGFVGVSILLRGLAELTEYAIPVIAVLNTLMLIYVFVTIHIELEINLGQRKNINSIFEKQYDEYRKNMKTGCGVGIFVAIIYWILMYLLKSNGVIGGVVNDSVAYITFGLSLEANRIYIKLEEYYTQNDFSIRNR